MVAALLFWTAAAAAATVHLDARDSSSTVILHVGDRLRVELPSAPATGFRWKAKALDASHLELLTKDVRPESRQLDASGMQVFWWKAISPGKADLALQYYRPSDDQAIAPAKHMDIAVEVVAEALTSAAQTEVGSANGDALLTPGMEKLGTYQGTLPCADCTGIAVELTLYALHAKELTGTVFTETRRYQGAPGGDRTIAGTGRWAVQHGTDADASITVYVLAAPGGGIENLKLDGDRLVPLDTLMLPVPVVGNQGDGSLHLVHEILTTQ